MPKVDPGRTIRDAQELITESKKLMECSRLIIQRSKHLQDRLGIPYPKVTDRARRKHPLKT